MTKILNAIFHIIFSAGVIIFLASGGFLFISKAFAALSVVTELVKFQTETLWLMTTQNKSFKYSVTHIDWKAVLRDVIYNAIGMGIATAFLLTKGLL